MAAVVGQHVSLLLSSPFVSNNLKITPSSYPSSVHKHNLTKFFAPNSDRGKGNGNGCHLRAIKAKKNPWLDPFDYGEDPDMEYGELYSDGKQDAEYPRPPDNPDSEFGFLKFPKGYNVEIASLGAMLRGDVRVCLCMVAGGVYENLLFFPVIQLLRDRYPGVRIDMIATARGKQTYEMNKNVRYANVYDVEKEFVVPADYMEMIGMLKNRYYDLVISTKLAGLGHSIFMFLTSARTKIGYVYPNVNAVGAGLFLTEALKAPQLDLADGGYNMYKELIEQFAQPGRNVPRQALPPLRVSISRKLREVVETKYKDAGLEKGEFLVIHGIESDSEATMQSRGDYDSLLPIKFWADLSRSLSSVKVLFVIPHERERENIMEAVGEDSNIVFITTPGQLAALINDSIGVVATNTAAIQLAHALDKPSVALFSSIKKANLFIPNATEKRCTIIASETGKLADINTEDAKVAIKDVFEKSMVAA